MPRAEIPEKAVEAACRTYYLWWDDDDAVREDERSPEEVRRTLVERGPMQRAIKAASPILRAHWLEQLKGELLGEEVIDMIAEQNAIAELYGHWEDIPSRENKEARQRQRYAQLAKKPGVQESWKVGARRDVERFLAAIPIEEGN